MNWSRLEESKFAVTFSNRTNPVGKRPLGKQRMRWEDVIKKDVEQLAGDANWRNLVFDRERWKLVYETG